MSDLIQEEWIEKAKELTTAYGLICGLTWGESISSKRNAAYEQLIAHLRSRPLYASPVELPEAEQPKSNSVHSVAGASSEDLQAALRGELANLQADYEGGVMRQLASLRAQNADVAAMLLDNDREGAVRWAKGLVTTGATVWAEPIRPADNEVVPPNGNESQKDQL